MTRLYRKYREGNDWKLGTAPAKSLEGKITKCEVRGAQRINDSFHPPSLHFEIDSLKDTPLKISGTSFRLDVGERVRLHSYDGFDRPYCEIEGLEILDHSGNTKFRYLNGPSEGFYVVFES